MPPTIPPQCENLSANTQQLLDLLKQEASLRNYDTTTVQSSLRKVSSPCFEVVFAGAFSAGKSMLINAILGRELLYSAEGHATGTECRIAYANSAGEERVVLTFMSEVEVRELVDTLCRDLGMAEGVNINNPDLVNSLGRSCMEVIVKEGGENRSEVAKRANALKLLLEGFRANRDKISTQSNAIFSMEKLNFSSLQEAASYARRGVNSSVLKRIEYYCHDPLLEDGNVIIDTPGIDAPVERDAQLTFKKIEDPDVSAVVSVLKPASAGELTPPETKLLEKTKSNPNIRDRVFYVFNRIDETWYNAQLRQRLEKVINTDFRDSRRVYSTSGLLGFYGRLLKGTNYHDRFGLDSIFAESVKGEGGLEETPQFVYAFLNYCGSSGKLPSNFRIDIRSYESSNENYVRILNDWGLPLITQLVEDSGIEQFRESITRYLREEKRPLLFANLADDLQPICIALQKQYLEQYYALDSQPREAEVMKVQELAKLSQDLQRVGEEYLNHVRRELNEAIASDLNQTYEGDYRNLKSAMVARLDELINNFSVADVHRRAQASHPRNSVVPVMGILVEAFYYLANELETVLVANSKKIAENFFQGLLARVQEQAYYRELYRLLGDDGGIETSLRSLQEQVIDALKNEAKTECDRYVRERPEFYVDSTVSIWQLRQTLQQACRGYDYKSMIDAEPAIKQLLKMDFEQKVKETVIRTYRQTINQTLNDHLLSGADDQTEQILLQYDRARSFLEQTLDKEVNEKIESNRKLQQELKSKIDTYNQAVNSINSCLQTMQLDRKQLPLISLVKSPESQEDLNTPN
jgi:hypothetical protein